MGASNSAGRSIALLLLSRGFATGGFGLAPPVGRRPLSPRMQRAEHPAMRAPPSGAARRSGTAPRTKDDGVLSARSRDAVPDDGGVPVRSPGGNPWRHYFSMMRPVTILQAAGAFLVGRLVVLSQQGDLDRTTILPVVAASLSIYLSYGAGMAMNDCADVDVDSLHEAKRERSLASDAISVRSGWLFCVGVSITSVGLAWLADWIGGRGRGSVGGVRGVGFVSWSLLNLALMAGYALGMQRVFLVKNLLCGFFAISPLLGASLLGGAAVELENDVVSKLYQLAAIGFPLQVSREILKDIEDVDVDRGKKRTLPLAIGEANSKRIAYGLVAAVNAGMVVSPYYWKMFASNPPIYAASVVLGTPMCVAASRLPLAKGQTLLKKSIYVLLSGMISGLLIQSLQ